MKDAYTHFFPVDAGFLCAVTFINEALVTF